VNAALPGYISEPQRRNVPPLYPSLWAMPTASSAECKACREESAGLGRKTQVTLASVKQEVSSK